MNMPISSEKENCIISNMKLVHYLVLNYFGINPNSPEYEDIVSIGTIGLIKAEKAFDPSKKIAFSTFASTCIKNEILMYFRKAKRRQVMVIPIDEPVKDVEGEELTLGDTIEHPESDFVEEIVNKEDFIQLMNIILNLEGRKRLVILYRMGEVSQADIAEKLDISPSYVSRIRKKAIREVAEIAKQQIHYKKVFSIASVGDTYSISFSPQDISKSNQSFTTLLQNLTSTKKLPNFRVTCNEKQIVVQIPAAHPESFSFIAQLIQEIDEFSMTFVSNKST